MSFPNDTYGSKESELILSHLQETKHINKKIFCFNKFILNENTIETTFYLGEAHEHFTLKNVIVGTINLNEEDFFLGFSFNQMILYNISINLTRKK